ncbi:DMT family transporter [Aquibium sp. A9E412]|uniref:DMT family transporter n=1 Tax=Aquibium sp. A9E412 TaxID=2976767 RepID=UPI0025B244AE|nr:DMT family transporter [Aquibium sp. A9E412]MDN2564868.1 DMT family transporter [Aquibium sp. A9E412]
MARGGDTAPVHAALSAPLGGLAAVFASVFFWQSGLIVQKVLVAGSNVGSIMLVQLGAAAALMWAALFAAGRLPPADRRSALHLAWGVLAPGLVFALAISGARLTDGASVALIWGLFPIAGPLMARVLLGERLHWTFPAGGLVGFAGLALMTLSRSADGTSVMAGNLLVLAAVFFASLNSVIARVFNRGRSVWYHVATLQLTGAGIAAAVFVAATGWSPPDLARPGELAAMAYLVLFMTVMNFLGYNYALSRVAVAWVGLLGALAPVFGLSTAALLLGVRLDGSDLIFVGIILCGVALPHLRRALAGRVRAAG